MLHCTDPFSATGDILAANVRALSATQQWAAARTAGYASGDWSALAELLAAGALRGALESFAAEDVSSLDVSTYSYFLRSYERAMKGPPAALPRECVFAFLQVSGTPTRLPTLPSCLLLHCDARISCCCVQQRKFTY